MKLPDRHGHFGPFGGQYVAETLMPALTELEQAYRQVCRDPLFKKEVEEYARNYVGRPTPLYAAPNLSKALGGGKVYLKREDLCHTGAHKINNTLGQCLLAKHMGKKRVIAETGAGQHGVATATMATLLGLQCVVYMGDEDVHRQSLNVLRMRLLGAEVIPVHSGSKTLKDALNEALRDWVTNVADTYYCIGSVAGPHPYPMMVRDFQAVIGLEVKKQFNTLAKKDPDYLIACVGGGSNAIGLFYPFLDNPQVKMIGVEAAGEGLSTSRHAATLVKGAVGVLHGSKSYLLQDRDGQVQATHSISAGLDYPGVGPEHSYLYETKRVQYVAVTDREAMAGFDLLAKTEGIIAALESSHALGYLIKWAPSVSRHQSIVVNLSGRGDKDMGTVAQYYGVKL